MFRYSRAIRILAIVLFASSLPIAFSQDEEPPETTDKKEADATNKSEGGLSADEFQQQFWKYLQKGPAAYDEWAPLPGKKADLVAGESPHGDLIRVWANKAARSNPDKMPSGSILIKENFNGESTLAAVTVMYRTTDYNPEGGDWYWIKYQPDGSVAKDSTEADAKALAGRVKSCIDCHADAAGGDFVFANDPK